MKVVGLLGRTLKVLALKRHVTVIELIPEFIATGLGGGGVSDRLTLAHAIEDAGIERTKAEHVASAIFDAIRDNVATKADIASVKADVAAVKAKLTLVEHRLMTRLGGLMIVVGDVLFAALHYWPPSGHG